MAHLLIVDLPAGRDEDILTAAIQRGDDASFVTATLDGYAAFAMAHIVLKLACNRICVPGFEYEEVERQVMALHQKHPIDAVLCLIETRLITAARLAQKLGVPHISPECTALLRDKFSVRQRLLERGIAQPEFALAESASALMTEVNRLGLPVLVKPCDGSGSSNIVLMRDEDERLAFAQKMAAGYTPDQDYGLGVHANGRLLLERYMQGQIIGCDTMSVNGEHRMLGVHEKVFFPPPSFAIKGGCFTPNGPPFAAIEAYVFSALDAVGFNWGATHIELMLSADGPRLIEINPRLVGAWIPRLVGLALGRSIHSDLIDVHLGRWPTAMAKAPAKIAVSRWITARSEGVLERVVLPPNVSKGAVLTEVLLHPGAHVRPPLENVDRIGFVMARANSRHEAERIATRVVAQTQVVLRKAASGKPENKMETTTC
jgi:biotin carboxylase